MPKAGKKKAPDPLLEVYEAIKRRINRQDTAHMFICKHDLDQVWADHPLPHIFPRFTPEECESVRKDYICVLSILIYVGWTDWSRFRPLFLREGRNDAHLPFADVKFLGTSEQVFHSHQYAFKPAIIEERDERYIQDISTKDRLPFIDEPEFMDNGGYGSVTKRVIAPRCLWNKQDNKDNPKVCGHSLQNFGIHAHSRDPTSPRLSHAKSTNQRFHSRTSIRKWETSISSKKASQIQSA